MRSIDVSERRTSAAPVVLVVSEVAGAVDELRVGSTLVGGRSETSGCVTSGWVGAPELTLASPISTSGVHAASHRTATTPAAPARMRAWLAAMLFSTPVPLVAEPRRLNKPLDANLVDKLQPETTAKWSGADVAHVAEYLHRMRIDIGSDHAGYELKAHLIDHLRGRGHEVTDHGTDSSESTDYAPICAEVARAVVSGNANRGIVLGGSGQGEQIAANKVDGARAALCHDLWMARMSRLHNDANILSMGARVVTAYMAAEIVDLWLGTEFEGGRHQRRVDQIAEIERSNSR